MICNMKEREKHLKTLSFSDSRDVNILAGNKVANIK